LRRRPGGVDTDGVDAVDFDTALAAARVGEEWGFAALYAAFAPSVLGFLRGRIPADAEDVAATVWLDAARNLGDFTGDAASFRAWIFTITRRRMLNERRRRARRPVELSATGELPRTTAADDPATHVVVADASDAAIALVREVLPELQGEVVLLRVVGGLSVHDIATLLELAPGHVRVLSHRGLKALAAHFSPLAVTPGAEPGISGVR
jgi:RNA polymerase sigma-70 factor (ECF subfamily)